jgi:hypothetical protein
MRPMCRCNEMLSTLATGLQADIRIHNPFEKSVAYCGTKTMQVMQPNASLIPSGIGSPTRLGT